MSGDPYIKENDELRAEIARLESQLLIAQGCAALSSIGIDAHSALVDASKETMGKLIKAEAEIARLREWIVMAHNRLECKDCSQCVAVARSYLREALANKHSPRR